MNYEKIYSKIIEQGQNRILEGYGEKHHILPKCTGGPKVQNKGREFYINGILYNNLTYAAKDFNVSISTISNRLKNPYFTNYVYSDELNIKIL